MQWGVTLLLGAAVFRTVGRMRLLRRCGCGASAQRVYRRAAWAMGLGVWAMMLCQEAILLLCGQLKWQTGLPLHLCSMMGVVTLPMLLTQKAWLWHVTLYLGVPGALLALMFPAVMDTPWPRLTGLTFAAMHALVMLSPLLPLGLGMRPRARGAWQAWQALMLLGLAALAANALLGSNYLFLAAPVAGTPLDWLGKRGVWPYRLGLALAAAAVLAVQGGVVYWAGQRMIPGERM